MGNLTRYKYKISLVVLLIVFFKFLQYKYRKYQLSLVKVDIIYQEVISKLTTQLRLSRTSSNIKPFIGSNQLRDLILGNEHNLGERLRLWNQVSNKIENNTNVATNVVEDHGEIMKVWEWVNELSLEGCID
ncbi:uncharacterized protein LODBEIA_P40750 [Lodderomyces beijingensis]|uniref:Man1/Src1-like C-terminal domain-containing protein n=1 Tax=Lodderomyces beijingensis TaxID=1775926 RepID=A0ABP0ZNW5_9ASCO